MITHEALRNAIRSRGFEFKRQADRVEIFKQRGTTTRVELRRISLHDDDYAQTILRQAGFGAEEIADFMREQRQAIN